MKKLDAIFLVCFCNLALYCSGASLDTAFTYQGRLTDNGSPANGTYDLRVFLYDADAGGSQVSNTVLKEDVPVVSGLFTVELDFGGESFDGGGRWLEIGVRPAASTGAFTTLSPRQPMTAAPYALYASSAGNASFATNATTATTAARANAIAWSNITDIPSGFADGADNDTQYSAGVGLTLNGTSFAIATGGVDSPQLADNAVTAGFNGTQWTYAFGNDTQYTAGTGLTLSGTSFAIAPGGVGALQLSDNAVTPAKLADAAVTNAKLADGSVNANKLSVAGVAAGQLLKFNGTQWTYAADNDTTYAAGAGLSLSGNQFSVNFAGIGVANTAARSDHNHDTSYWKRSGSSGTTPGTDFIGTTDNQALEIKVNNARALRIEPGRDNQVDSPNMIGGHSVNYVGANVSAATICGGGGSEFPGFANAVTASGGTVCGGVGNTAAGYDSFAAGFRAKANHHGAFVWADQRSFDFPSTAANEFSVRATGGVRFVTGIDGGGNATAGVSLLANDTSWNVISDRAAKKNFRPANCRQVLERLSHLPIERWNYKWEGDGAVPHIGPTAQDFKAAFYPGRDDKTISTLEADGVALAAIQGLSEIVKEKDDQIQALKKDLADLKEIVTRLVQQQNGGTR